MHASACHHQEHGKFPEIRQGNNFCIRHRPGGGGGGKENMLVLDGVRVHLSHGSSCCRCTGKLVTKKEGNYKFFLSSDDGVALSSRVGSNGVDMSAHGAQARVGLHEAP